MRAPIHPQSRSPHIKPGAPESRLNPDGRAAGLIAPQSIRHSSPAITLAPGSGAKSLMKDV